MFSQIVKFAVESTLSDHVSDRSRFFVDDDDNYEEEEDILFCKNNVCVHPAKGKKTHMPGYFTVKSRTRKSGHVRLIVTWTPNSHLTGEKALGLVSIATAKSPLLISELQKADSLEVFSVDLSEMKTIKLFYDEKDPACGQLVIGNHENHYKVLHFHHGGLNRVTQILEDWEWCVGQRTVQDEVRKRCFVVVARVPVLEDCYAEEGRYDPMSVDTWKTFLNCSGQIEDVANFNRAAFFGGLSPEVRKEAWMFLLYYYSFNSTYEERSHWRKEKERSYLEFHNSRLSMSHEEQNQFWRAIQCTVDKDVPRTDRSHPYFAGEGNPNIEVMRNILLNYAVYNPHVGYSQGMSDLLSPVLAVIQDEVDAFWCFVGLMEASVFVTSPKDDIMDKQLAYLRELLRMLEPKFYAHLLIEDAGLDMLFVHRWLLLCFKREFFDAEVLLMWEACWSRYQTEYFHLFLCVGMVQEYGQEVLHRDMKTDEMLQYFTDLSMKMDGSKVLRIARQLLLKFRKLPFIPCTLRGLLSGPGIWDSAPLPGIECHCHGNCYYGGDTGVSNDSAGVEIEECMGYSEKYEDEMSEKDVTSNGGEKDATEEEAVEIREDEEESIEPEEKPSTRLENRTPGGPEREQSGAEPTTESTLFKNEEQRCTVPEKGSLAESIEELQPKTPDDVNHEVEEESQKELKESDYHENEAMEFRGLENEARLSREESQVLERQSKNNLEDDSSSDFEDAGEVEEKSPLEFEKEELRELENEVQATTEAHSDFLAAREIGKELEQAEKESIPDKKLNHWGRDVSVSSQENPCTEQNDEDLSDDVNQELEHDFESIKKSMIEAELSRTEYTDEAEPEERLEKLGSPRLN